VRSKNSWTAMAWWLMPVIPTMWEAEIGRITVPGQPGQWVLETLFQPTAGHGGIPLSSHYSRKCKWEDPSLAKKQEPYVQNNHSKKGWHELTFYIKDSCSGRQLAFHHSFCLGNIQGQIPKGQVYEPSGHAQSEGGSPWWLKKKKNN
jgi:hypothetical protein